MLLSLTHRIISAEGLGLTKSYESIQWARECIDQNIINDSILILASLSDIDSWEVKDCLEQSVKRLGLQIQHGAEALHCYIQSFVIELSESHSIEKELSMLSNIYCEFEHPKIIRNFWLLYWANISWLQDHENKQCYWEGFTLEKADTIVKKEAVEWLNKYRRNYFDLQQLEANAR